MKKPTKKQKIVCFVIGIMIGLLIQHGAPGEGSALYQLLN